MYNRKLSSFLQELVIRLGLELGDRPTQSQPTGFGFLTSYRRLGRISLSVGGAKYGHMIYVFTSFKNLFVTFAQLCKKEKKNIKLTFKRDGIGSAVTEGD